jgi:hypothetical protein
MTGRTTEARGFRNGQGLDCSPCPAPRPKSDLRSKSIGYSSIFVSSMISCNSLDEDFADVRSLRDETSVGRPT